MKKGLTAILMVLMSGCGPTVKVQSEPIRVEPIHITVDVNLRVDRRLEEFFDYQREVEGKKAP